MCPMQNFLLEVVASVLPNISKIKSKHPVQNWHGIGNSLHSSLFIRILCKTAYRGKLERTISTKYFHVYVSRLRLLNNGRLKWVMGMETGYKQKSSILVQNKTELLLKKNVLKSIFLSLRKKWCSQSLWHTKTYTNALL